jgi:Spy/CpxP family protein refolding chaperone
MQQQQHEQQMQQQQMHEEGFHQHLFPPEIVMRHQQRLQLTEQQRTTIKEAVKQLQTQVVEHQWTLQEQNQALSEMLAGESVDAAAALQQVDRLLDTERQVKRMHLELLIRIKNSLTSQQQELLRQLTGMHREMDHEMGMGSMMEHRDLGPPGMIHRER